MKIHPDGTLEGTAEELALYQGKMADAKKVAERVQHVKDARPWKHRVPISSTDYTTETDVSGCDNAVRVSLTSPLLTNATVEQLIEELNKKSTLLQRHVTTSGNWQMEITNPQGEENHTISLTGESIIFVYDKRPLINK